MVHNVALVLGGGGAAGQAWQIGVIAGLAEAEALRKQGSHVEVITPDADSRAARGTNQMDPATRIPAARAGLAQGKQEATRVTFL
jgi:hypothetical protein